MSKERIIELWSKLDHFKVNEKTPGAGLVAAIGMNQKTGDMIVQYMENLNSAGDKDVQRRYTIIPREQVVRIDGVHIDGPTLVTPTGMEV